MPRIFALAVSGLVTLAGPALAQQAPTSSPSTQMTQPASNLPAPCRTAAEAGGHGRMMQGMGGGMSQDMQAMMGQMTETQKGLHEAMMKMNGPMMMGMMAKDADVAWICAMIPHHQGAIEMARAGLKGADNAESKQFAEKTIRENEKSMKDLIDWVEKHAQRESRNETGAAPRQ